MALSGFPRHVERHHPDLIGRRVLVALSGGADSVALLHLLMAPALGIDLVAAHVHHRVRGTEADRDARFCATLCGRLGIPCHVLELAAGGRRPEGREASWRRRRYQALLDAARRLGAVAVATGHHRDDVAEGVLLQLLRGTGPRGLAGIHAATPDGLVRPLLPWRRTQIHSWLSERGIDWVEDSSNRSDDHLRNVVRHEILPQLRLRSPRLDDHLVRLSAALADDERFLAAELDRRACWIDPWSPDGGVPIASIAELPAALRVRWLHAQVARLGIGRATRRQAELLAATIEGGEPRAITLAGRWRLRAAAGRLWAEPPEPPRAVEQPLTVGDDIPLGVPGWTLRIRSTPSTGPPERGWTWRPRSATGLAVRGARSGETVPGPGGPVRVARLLAAAVPRHLRQAWPVLVVDDTISWIPGVWTNPDQAGGRRMEVEVTRR